MAWTAPADFNTGEVVTAAKLNTHIRDNLLYLKGSAGAISLDARLTATAGASSEDTIAARSGNSANYVAVSVGRTAGEAEMAISAGAGHFFTGTVAGDAVVRNNDAAKKLFLGAGPNGAVETMTITSAAVGIGTNTPQGRLHIGGVANGGAIFFDSASVAGSAVAVLPAAGMTAVGIGFAVARSTDNAISGTMNGPFLSVPGAGNNDYNIVTDGGTNICVLRVASTGAVSLIRTAGSKTYRVILWMLYY